MSERLSPQYEAKIREIVDDARYDLPVARPIIRDLLAELHAVRAENKELREALKEVREKSATDPRRHSERHDFYCLRAVEMNDIERIARAALEKSK